MELKSGYKQTDLGVIPEEWAVKELTALLEQSRGVRYGIVQPGKYDPRGCLMLRSQDYSKGWANPDDMHRVNSLLENQYRNARIRSSDLIMTIVGAGIGQVEVAPNWLDGAILSRSTARIAIDKTQAARRFVAAFLESPLGKRQILNCQKEGAQPVVSCRDLANFLVPYPPPSEQRAIAGALSDVDALIGALDQLIAKKRDLKQAAMQQLLTGQKRLPGFGKKQGFKDTESGLIPADWDVNWLSSLTTLPIQNGIFNEPARKGRGCKLINVIDLYSALPIGTTNLERFDATRDEIARFGVAHGDLFFTRSSLTPDGIAHCNICARTRNEHIVFDCHIIRVRVNASKVNPFFLARYCTSRSARSYLIANAKTTTMTTIDQAVIANLPVPIPPLREQTAIAEVLTNMDAELAALEQRRDKTRALKQGMMQELLTGRTRLV